MNFGQREYEGEISDWRHRNDPLNPTPSWGSRFPWMFVIAIRCNAGSFALSILVAYLVNLCRLTYNISRLGC